MTTAIEQLDALLERHRQGYRIEYGDLMEIRAALWRALPKPVQEAVLKKNRLIVEHQQSDNPEGGAA